jgi:photosystem II stability/assembly factor-like uncharacterized protein
MRIPNLLYATGCVLMAVSCSKKDHPAPTSTDTTNTTAPITDTAHWQTINTGFPGTAFNDVWFTDSLHGFLLGNDNYIYNSSDGGFGWQRYTGISGQFQVFYFLNASQGYAVGQKQLAITTNGGQTWTVKALTGVAVSSSVWPSIQFTAPDTGYLAVGQGIYKTTDMGSSWTLVDTRPVNALFFGGGDTGYVYYPADSCSRTPDGGSTWQPAVIFPQTYQNNTANVAELQFTDAQHGWFMGSNNIVTTSDGGNSWKNVYSTSDGNTLPFLDFQMLSNTEGYVAGPSQMMKTTDGGNTWQLNYQLFSSNGLSAPAIASIYFTDENHGWACCTNGVVLRYRP